MRTPLVALLSFLALVASVAGIVWLASQSARVVSAIIGALP
jgi:hypothetical protein